MQIYEKPKYQSRLYTTDDLSYYYEIENKLLELILSNPIRLKDRLQQQQKFNQFTRELKLYRYIDFKDFDYLTYLKNLIRSHKIEYTQSIKIKLYRLISNSDVLRITSYSYALINPKTKTVIPRHRYYTVV